MEDDFENDVELKDLETDLATDLEALRNTLGDDYAKVDTKKKRPAGDGNGKGVNDDDDDDVDLLSGISWGSNSSASKSVKRDLRAATTTLKDESSEDEAGIDKLLGELEQLRSALGNTYQKVVPKREASPPVASPPSKKLKVDEDSGAQVPVELPIPDFSLGMQMTLDDDFTAAKTSTRDGPTATCSVKTADFGNLLAELGDELEHGAGTSIRTDDFDNLLSGFGGGASICTDDFGGMLSGIGMEAADNLRSKPVNQNGVKIIEPHVYAKWLDEALTKNKDLQKELKATLAGIDLAIEQNGKAKNLAKGFQKMKSTDNRKIPRPSEASLINLEDSILNHAGYVQASYWSRYGKQPAPNEDTKRMAPSMQFLPPNFRKTNTWSVIEQERLCQGILARAQENLSFLALKGIKNYKGECPLALSEVKQAMEDLRGLRLNTATALAVVGNFSETDWEEVARKSVVSRTAFECKLQWNCFTRPDRNTTPFSKEEAQHLRTLAEKYNEQNWVKIAEELGTNRHPAECLRYYKQNVVILHHKWTKDMDLQLRRAVQLYGSSKSSFQFISSQLGIAKRSCEYRWKEVVSIKRRKTGRWTLEEDIHIVKGILKHGKAYNKVAEDFQGTRNANQIRERFVYHLQPFIAKGKFTREEKQKLMELVRNEMEVHGKVRWATIATEFEGRTDRRIASEWEKMTRIMDKGKDPLADYSK